MALYILILFWWLTFPALLQKFFPKYCDYWHFVNCELLTYCVFLCVYSNTCSDFLQHFCILYSCIVSFLSALPTCQMAFLMFKDDPLSVVVLNVHMFLLVVCNRASATCTLLILVIKMKTPCSYMFFLRHLLNKWQFSFIHVFFLPALNKKRVQSIWQLFFKRRT